MLTKTRTEQNSMMIALKNLSKIKLDVFTKHIIAKNIQVLQPLIDRIHEAQHIEGEKEYDSKINAIALQYSSSTVPIPGIPGKMSITIPKEKREEYKTECEKIDEEFKDVVEFRANLEKTQDAYYKTTDEIEGLLTIRLKEDFETEIDISPLVDLIEIIEKPKPGKRR